LTLEEKYGTSSEEDIKKQSDTAGDPALILAARIGTAAASMNAGQKPDLDERFTLYGEDLEEVLRRLLADEDEQASREAIEPKQP
jgi:hypothetical protein